MTETFVTYFRVSTARQGCIPDMLEVLLIVQFIQIALHSSVGRAGQFIGQQLGLHLAGY